MDQETKKLDSEIINFMREYGCVRADDGFFQKLALKIFKYQFDRNSNYQKFCLIEGKRPGSVKDWKEIPAIPTVGFKELVLASFPVKKAIKVFKTSGTTQQSRGAHFFESLKLYDAAILPPFREYVLPATKVSAPARPVGGGLRPNGNDFLFCFLVSPPKESPDSSLSYMMGVVNLKFAKKKGRFYFRKNAVEFQKLHLDLRSTKRKTLILSTAFSLKAFLDFLAEKKASLRLPKGSGIMETGGFKGKIKEVSKTVLYQACEDRLGVPKDHCVSEYGMTELSSQFYDTTLYDRVNGIKRAPFKAGPAWIRTLVIDPKTGREAKKGNTGLLRHFDLANRGSVLAVQTEDLGKCVGDGFEIFGRASNTELRGCSLNYEKYLGA